MGEHTLLILINIFIICVISIIIVKLYYRNHEDSEISFGSLSDSFFARRDEAETEKIITQSEKNRTYNNVSAYFNSPNNNINMDANRQEYENKFNYPHGPQSTSNPYANNNKKLNLYNLNKKGDRMTNNNSAENVNFGKNTNVKKTEANDVAEKIKQESSNRIVTTDQSTKKETYTEIKEEQPKAKNQELKDLFTIDELIKESKRKSKPKSTADLNQTNQTTTTTSSGNTVQKFLTPEERENMKDHINDLENKINEKAAEKELNTATRKVENESMADVIKNSNSPISAPTLKSPTKSDDYNSITKDAVEKKINSLGNEVDQSTKKETYTEIKNYHPTTADQPLRNDLFEDATEVTISEDDDLSFDGDLFNQSEDDYNDLDYRKDIAKFTNKVKNSKIFNDVKNRLSTEDYIEDNPSDDEEFLRNVRSYGVPEEPIIPQRNEIESPHIKPEDIEKSKLKAAKELHIKAPKRECINVKINNNDTVLKKGDEIIYKYDGETYSSGVFSIDGDDIEVMFRGQHITIKPTDIKKIF